MSMWAHRISGSVVLITTLLYGIVGFVKMNMTVKNDVHAPMGVAVTSLISFLAISGVVARSCLNRAEKN